jgi:hypothetical protein
MARGDVIRPEHVILAPAASATDGRLPSLDDIEREHVERVMAATGGRKNRRGADTRRLAPPARPIARQIRSRMRHRGAWVTSLRTKLTAIVLVCALLPLAVLSLWLVRNTQRSAEEALRARLDTTLSRAAYQVGVSWIGHRSALFDIAQDSTVRALLVGGHATAGPMPLARPHDFANLRAGTHVVLIVDASNRPRWVLAADEKGGPVLLPAADSLKVGGRTVVRCIRRSHSRAATESTATRSVRWRHDFESRHSFRGGRRESEAPPP